MAGPERPPWVPVKPPGAGDLPYDDGEPMETPRHRRQMNILIESLEHSLKDRDDVFVGGNMFFYYNQKQIESNDFRGPDIFVVLDTEQRERLSWVVWEEGGQTPDVIIELTSPMTSSVDHEEKKKLYAKVLSVGEYFIYDPLESKLEGYALDLTSRSYQPITPADDGSFPCAQLDLSLKVVDDSESATWLRWQKGGKVLPTPLEASQQALKQVDNDLKRVAEAKENAADVEMALKEAELQSKELEQRAFDAERRADKAESRADEHSKRADDQSKRVETERQRADDLAKRADSEAQRADSEARRADAESKRADAESKRVKELNEKLESLEKKSSNPFSLG